MEIKGVKLIYFSATNTTRKVLEGIAKGIAIGDAAHVNLTFPEDSPDTISISSDELALIGAPVYGGRLPGEAVQRFKRLKADGTPAVLVVVYGNRAFEDALLELKRLTQELGFNPVAGAAFIGEHSFASEDCQVACGRPDSRDLQTATTFGKGIKEKLSKLTAPDLESDLEVPGSFPYEAGGAKSMGVSPVTLADKCIVCGACAEVCPTGAISVGDEVKTEAALCMRCCACIKNCTEGARVMENDKWKGIAAWLAENCKDRKEPELFGI